MFYQLFTCPYANKVHFKKPSKKHLVALTLGHGAEGLLSGRLDFSVSGEHGIEEQPALIASLQHHWLTAENGSAVPL